MKYFIANWKLNGNLVHLADYVKTFNDGFLNTSQKKVVICPPFPYIRDACMLFESSIAIGGQDCSAHHTGAYTSEVSAFMLRDCGCKYVLIGHSEVRSTLNETNETIKNKIIQATKAQLIPVLCIGENSHTRTQGKTEEFLAEQLSVLESIKFKGIIAYEPIWAIGSGQPIEINDLIQVVQFIKKIFSYPVLYGGSVNNENYKDFLRITEGILVGNASLQSSTFLTMVNDKVEK